jgi:hypothetical protein
MYAQAPALAYSGWRLRIPGGPEGGQYHGFVAQDAGDQLLNPTLVRGGPPPADSLPPWDDVWGGIPLAEGENRSDYVYRSSAEMRPRANASGGTNVISALQTRKTAGYAEAPGSYKGVGIYVAPFVPETCQGPGCPGAGATAVVSQPPPPSGTPGGTLTTYVAPPISPSPSPTVSATPTTVATSNSWFTESTIFPGVENLWVALAGGLAAFLLLRGHL